MFEMIENLFDNCWVFDTGDDFDSAATLIAGFDIDLENTFQALSPSHGSMSLGCRFVLILPAPAAFSWSHLRAKAAVGGEDTVEASEVHTRFWNQGSQAGDEVQGCKLAEMEGVYEAVPPTQDVPTEMLVTIDDAADTSQRCAIMFLRDESVPARKMTAHICQQRYAGRARIPGIDHEPSPGYRDCNGHEAERAGKARQVDPLPQ